MPVPEHPSPPSVPLPRLPEVPSSRRFPLVATIAPVAASIVLFAVTRSALTLAFALLGPVVAVASTADSALHRRRARRLESARFALESVEAERLIDESHAAERAELERALPGALSLAGATSAAATGMRSGSPWVVRVGRGTRASSLVLSSPGGGVRGAADTASSERLRALTDRAARVPSVPVSVDAAGGIGIVGPPGPRSAIARAVVLQLAARLDPQATRIESSSDADWEWLAVLPQHAAGSPAAAHSRAHVIRLLGDDRQPHNSSRPTSTSTPTTATIALAPTRAELPNDISTVIELGDRAGSAWSETVGEFQPEFVSLESAWAAAERLARRAESEGFARAIPLPEVVELGDLRQTPGGSGLLATIGIADDGNPLDIDLVADGPHAVVGGTTGSGKSELLVSWVLAMAATRSPREVAFLFVDFKGGAAFDPLARLPHRVGVITDLDAEQTLRALASLAAELRYRERTLSALGLRSIDDRSGGIADGPPFPRLVVVVDEYAALVESHSGLHTIFADIAARGRSLGVHLVLCTQRPAGVVRDAILANCPLRLSLRVMSSSDSVAVLGTDVASSLPVRPVGRAFVSVGGESPRAFQVARSLPDDVARVASAWESAEQPRVPWLPRLPSHIGFAQLEVERVGNDLPFALADLPDEQAQRVARWDPASQGSLLIVGGPRSGKSGTLAALAEAPSHTLVHQLPKDFPQLWDALFGPDLDSRDLDSREPDSRGDPDAGTDHPRLLLLDDLDAIASACDEAYRSAFLDRMASLLREGPAVGVHFAITAQRITGLLQQVAGLCGSTLMLRMPSRQEHVLSGGLPSDYSESLPPGGGHWRGTRVQVVEAKPMAPAVAKVAAVELDFGAGEVIVVSTAPERFAESIRRAAPERHVVLLGQARVHSGSGGLDIHNGGAPDILVADPDTWQSQWGLFTSLRRSGLVLLEGCSLAEVRTLTRSRELPPPIPRSQRALWLLQPDGGFVRGRLPD